MSGSNSSAPGSGPAPESLRPLSFAVHAMHTPALLDGAGADAQRTRRGRLKMLLVLLICAAPVVASYVTYYIVRPDGRTNYSELINPIQPVPAELPLADLQGGSVKAKTLKGQWLLVVVSGGACDARCEKYLWLQRQLRETLGREKDRVDKVWLIDDAAVPRAQTLDAVRTHTEITILRAPRAALERWLTPASGRALEEHFYIVDPLGNWMMRVPVDPDPARFKRDVEKLLRASAGWDKAGR